MNDKLSKDILKAKKLMQERNFDKAVRLLKRLLNNNPDNFCIKFDFVKCLIKTYKTKEDMEIAKKYLMELLKTPYRTSAMLELGKLKMNYGNLFEAKRYFLGVLESGIGKNYALLELVFLEMKLENYKQALIYLDDLIICNEKISIIYNYNNIVFYLKLKLGLLSDKDKDGLGYLSRQMLNYNEKSAIKHISKHLDKSENKEIHSVFFDNIDIVNLFREVNNNFCDMKFVSSTVVDNYMIAFDSPIGTMNGIETNKVEVVTLLNTNNIVVMYPIISSYNELENNTLEKSKVLKK